MDIIHLLPDSVANQIAAGEVIQRPASCLKELVENSLDAGAQEIHVIVRDAGRTLLQVVDDGSGMSETDLRMAFERHATSKIQSAQDLFALRTMGFRGEALASICAVAQVEVQSRREEDEMGSLLEIHGSNVVRSEACQCAKGTNFKVKNLFYNVPVRRKFLKTDQTELRNLLQEFYHIVLVYPKVHFIFVSNDEVILDLTPGSEKQRIEQVFGKGTGRQFTSGLVDIKTDTELVSIRGFVGKPEAVSRQSQQYFFVNGRYMRHPYFHKAILTAYSGMLPGGMVPSYFVYFEVNPEAIDVNIHPTKTEIKFADEQAIFQILMAAVRESLGKFDLTPTLDFDERRGEVEISNFVPSADVERPRVVVDPTYSPFKRTASPSVSSQSVPSQWTNLYSQSVRSEVIEQPIQSELFELDLEQVTPFQYANKYILIPDKLGLMFVNQHRAHYAILFERYMQQMSDRRAEAQQLLFPEVLELTSEDMALMQQIHEELRFVGFDVEQLSKTSYSISAVPATLTSSGAVTTLRNILHEVAQTQQAVSSEWQRRIALSLAKDTAIPYGKKLSSDEMKDLLSRLFNLVSYRIAPDGKRIISILTDEEIANRF